MSRIRDIANLFSGSTDAATDAEVASAVSNHNTAANGHIGRGNTAARPSSATQGDTYYNTQLNQLEVYDTGRWCVANTAPIAPTSVVATNVGTSRAYNNGSASVAFTAPTSGGPVTAYTVTSTPGSYTASGSSSPIVVAGLQSSTGYTYAVTSANSIATSSASSASSSVTATTVPQAPTIGTATAGSQSATVAYTAGATGGASATYTATSSPGGFTGTGTSPITVSGLTDGTSYTFTVTATNANGTSLASAASNSITPASGSFEQIATVSVGAGGQSYIEFTSIPQNYALLEIRMVGRCSASGAGPSAVALALNSDTTATNYWYGKQESTDGGTGGAATGQAGLVATSVNANNPGLVNNNGLNSNMFSTHIYRLYEYSNSSKNTTVQCYFGYEQGADTILNSKTGFGFMVWKNTNAVNALRLTASGGNWSQYSHAALYGLKGS